MEIFAVLADTFSVSGLLLENMVKLWYVGHQAGRFVSSELILRLGYYAKKLGNQSFLRSRGDGCWRGAGRISHNLRR